MERKSSTSTKRRLTEYLANRQPARITEAVWLELRAHLAPVSDSYLRDLLHAAQIPFDQPWAGIRQHTFEELESSLGEMLEVYRAAAAAGDRDRARYARRQVIAARERARFASRNSRTSSGKRAVKEEMAQWMLVWLENPEVFPAWVEARKRLQARV
ncbi:MAG: hypothetical protein ABSH42_02960 [Bryobacteraceae bacterium]